MGKDRKEETKLSKTEIAEAQLSKLVRAYKLMENDKFAYSSTPNGTLKTLRSQAEICLTEKQYINAELDVATAPAKMKEDLEIFRALTTILEEYECLGKSVKEERAQLIELDQCIHQEENKIAHIKKTAPTEEEMLNRRLQARRNVKVLEKKLDAFKKRNNVINHENTNLRNQIDHLLQERELFNKLWVKMLRNLNNGKKYMLDLIEQTVVTYNNRDEWLKKVEFLRNKGRYDLMLHKKEMRALDMELNNEQARQDFLGLKGQKRLELELETKQKKAQKELRRNLEQKLIEYQELLKQINDTCGVEDITKLLENYIRVEKENFSLLNCVLELNHDIEQIASSTKYLKDLIDEQKILQEKRSKEEEIELIELQTVLAVESAKVEQAKSKVTKFEIDINGVMVGLDDMFFILQCDDDPVLDLLFGQTGLIEEDDAVLSMTKYNVMIYIHLVENRIIEVIQMVLNKENNAAKQIKKGRPQPTRLVQPDLKTRYNRYLLPHLVPSQPCPLCVEREQVSDVIDKLQIARKYSLVEADLAERLQLPHALDRLHNVSACHLPESRKIIQQRYQ